MLELNERDFDERIARGTHVVDFSAEWCPPCRMLVPILERVAADLAGAAMFAKVDADGNTALLARFGIKALPTVVVFRDGAPVHVIRGLLGERALAAELGRVVAGVIGGTRDER